MAQTQISTPSRFNSTLQVTDFQLLAAQLLAMDGTVGTDVVVIPAQGANLLIVPESVYMNFHKGSILYTTGTGNLALMYTSGGAHVLTLAAPVITTAQIKGSSSAAAFQPPLATAVPLTAANAPLVLNLTTAVKYLLGTGNFLITIKYRIEIMV